MSIAYMTMCLVDIGYHPEDVIAYTEEEIVYAYLLEVGEESSTDQD